jgi:hypothetical protein
MSVEGYGHQSLAATIATSASMSTAIPIMGFAKITLELPSTTNLAGTTPSVYVNVARQATDTFRRLMITNDSSNTAASAIDWVVLTTTGNRFIPCLQAAGYAYMKVESSVSATAAAGWPVVVHGTY